MFFTKSSTIPEIIIIEPEIFEDDRGFFTEMYHREKFEEAGINGNFVQDNRSRSCQGTLRGLHYQFARPQGKLIWALEGEVFDVAVDIRRNSPTFGEWFGFILSGNDKKGLYIPPDFAHGFCVLSIEAEIFYKCTDLYSPEQERCIRWNDPDLAIDWPIKEPILSQKDANGSLLKDADLPN
ncbi:MAG: dTDP-4-dehydrorhamnose 3,5-epimerase [Deltaproteobacteria bacterium]|nr:dTDP-4-dehydrorhamnose 3,5-epimerase [Deltaproteobacteria bacterium]